MTEGVTGTRSYFIAQAARCEIRDSLIDLLVGAVGTEDVVRARQLARRDTRDGADVEESQRFQTFLDSGYKSLRNTDIRETIQRYTATLVAYEFDFNITRTDEFGGDLDLLSTFTLGTLKTNVGGGFKGQRNTSRNFKLIDVFGDMLVNRPTIRECNALRRPPHKPRAPNTAYPMTGSLNLREILDTFISLTQSANLVGNFVDKRDVPTFSETMIFTTTISAGVAPTLELEPLGRSLEISNAKAGFGSSRLDVHKLTLTLTLPPQGKLTVAQQRSLQREAALDELERQRVRAIDADTEEIRRRLLQN